jgi:hypothetical protein
MTRRGAPKLRVDLVEHFAGGFRRRVDERFAGLPAPYSLRNGAPEAWGTP